MIEFLGWWLIIQLFGLAALPLTTWLFRWLPDRGSAFAKAVGLLLGSYLLWLGASTGLLVNDLCGITAALLIVAGLSAWAARASGWTIAGWWRSQRSQVITAEILFLLAFAGWTLVRAYTPEKILPLGGEKYMEIAFLNGVLNSPSFPPLDPWLAGYGISYYYFGYVMMAVMARFSGTAPTVAFDLYDALLFALTAQAAYGVVSNLVASGGSGRRAAAGFGALGALFVTGLGNLEGLLEGLYASRSLPGRFWAWLDIPDLTSATAGGSFYPGHHWWWWRASRVIRDMDLSGQPVPFQPIDEFPFFSFLLGDNHPHKLALPFTLLALGLAFNLLARASCGPLAAEPVPAGLTGWRYWAGWVWVRRGEAALLLFSALALGALGFLNTWDFPVYLLIALLAHAAGAARARGGITRGGITRTLALGAGLGAAAVLLYLFFYLGFASQAGGVLPHVFPPTRLVQYLVMFGPFVLILLVFLTAALARVSAWRAALRAWLGIAAAAALLFAVVVLLASLLLAGTPLGDNPFLQPYLGEQGASGLVRSIFTARLRSPWLFLLLTGMLAAAAASLLRGVSRRSADSAAPLPDGALFALLLAFAGLGLTLVVEFFYLRDNFFMRMNTVFKFYFQGWVLMACASAYGLWWSLVSLPRAARAAVAAVAALLVSAALVYPVMAVPARTEGFRGPAALDAAATIAGVYGEHWAARPDDWAAIEWARANLAAGHDGPPLILEAPGESYEHAGRFSAFTGYPTLLGWSRHEDQWRGNSIVQEKRRQQVQTLYTTASAERAREQLLELGVDYVIVGGEERDYIQRVCGDPKNGCSLGRALEKFNSFPAVYDAGGVTIYAVTD